MKSYGRKILLIGCILCIVATLFVGCDKEDDDVIEQEPFRIAVLSDIHLLSEKEFDIESTAFCNYAVTKKTLLSLSESIFKTHIDDLIAEKPDVVFVTGDISDNGSRASLELASEEFSRLEQAGIQVFVTGGTFDFSHQAKRYTETGIETAESVDVEDFASIFAEYGYNDALTRDDSTLSYVTEIGSSKYRLLVIDTASLTDYTQEKFDKKVPPVTDDLLEYIEESLLQAQQDQKEMLVMSYFPINNDIGDYFGTVTKSLVVSLDRHEEIENLLTFYGAKYVFSGHTHAQKVLTYSDQYGDILDYTSSSATMYPLAVWTFTETEEELVKSEKRLTGISEKYVPSFLTAEEKQEVTTDLLSVAEKHVKDNVWNTFFKILNEDGKENGLFINLLRLGGFYDNEGLTEAQNNAALEIADDFYVKCREYLNLPLYGENSVESLCIRYGKTLPACSSTTCFDFIGKCVCDICTDDIHITGGSNESVVLRYIIYTGFYYIADLDLIDKMHTIRSEVNACDLRPLVDKLFLTDDMDLTINDTLLNVVTILNPYLQKLFSGFGWKVKLNFSDTAQLLNLLDTVLPYALEAMFGENHDENNDTLWGIKYQHYIDMKTGIIHLDNLLDNVFLDVLGRNLFS